MSLQVALPDNSAVTQWVLSLTVMSSNVGINTTATPDVGLWEAAISLPAGIAGSKDGELFYPTGFGISYTNPAESITGGQLSNTYPSGSASMQFMAVGRSSLDSALYVAAMDPVGEAKNLDYSSATTSPIYGSFVRIKIFPENAGVAISVGTKWSCPFAISVGAVSNVDARAGRPMWFEAGMIYRSWALRHAHWTDKGPLASRSDEFPVWFTDNRVWLNTHWQCHDIFNKVINIHTDSLFF